MEDLLAYIDPGSPGTLDDRLESLSDDDLEAVVIRFHTMARALEATIHHAVGVLEHREIPDRRYALSARQWLRRFCRCSSADAAATVATARALPAMPTIAKRALAGEIPAMSVRLLSSAHRRHPSDFPLHEEVFADAAASLDARDLRRVVAHWRQQVDHPSALRDIADARARRRTSIAQTADGMWHLEGLLDPETGSTVATALRSHADPGNISADEERSHGQRMADALGDICRFSLDHGDVVPTSGGEKPHITVCLDVDQLAKKSSRLPGVGGGVVTDEDVRRLSCDARIVRIVTDSAGEPLDVGRAVRTVTPAIRRALDHRDGGCVWNGCDRPAPWCDAHHIEHWADGGRTSLANMQLLCRRHHGLVHVGGDPVTGTRSPPDA